MKYLHQLHPIIALMAGTFFNLPASVPQTAQLAMNNAPAGKMTITDPSLSALSRLYQTAQKAYIKGNLNNAYQLYDQYVTIVLANHEEADCWKTLRQSFTYLGHISKSLNDYAAAVYFFKQAFGLNVKFDKTDISLSYTYLVNIAENLYNLGDFYNSLDSYQQALLLADNFTIHYGLSRARLLNNMALAYLKLGRTDESLSYLNQSEQTKIRTGDDHALITTYNNMGMVEQNRNNFTLARYYYLKGMHICDSLENQAESAFILNNLGNLFMKQGRPDSARHYYQRAYDLRRMQCKDAGQELIASLNNLAYAFLRLHKPDSALFYNHLAIHGNKPALPNESIQTGFSLPDYLTSIADHTEIQLDLQRTTGCADGLLNAYGLLFPAISAMVDRLLKLGSPYAINNQIFKNKRIFDTFMELSLRLDSIFPTTCPRSLVVSEIFKTLSMLDVNSGLHEAIYDSARLNKFRTINESLSIQNQLSGETHIPTREEAVELIDSLVNYSINTCQEPVNQSHHAETILADLKSIEKRILLKIKNLDDNLILDFYELGDFILIHLVMKDCILVRRVPYNEEFGNQVIGFCSAIKKMETSEWIKYSGQLFELLLIPCLDQIRQHLKLTLIPTGNTAKIPFEALPYSSNNETDFLVKHLTVSYRFTLLRHDFSESQPEKRYPLDFIGVTPHALISDSDQNLQFCATEILDARRSFTDTMRTRILIGQQADFSNLLACRLDAKIIHLSSHSRINQDRRLLSSIELFGNENQASLFLPSLSVLPIRCDLLIFNACETEKNLVDAEAGYISFIRSIYRNEINSYLASLWKIYDKPTWQFSKNLYGFISKGYSYDLAVSMAKREMIFSKDYFHPAFWAPYVLYQNN